MLPTRALIGMIHIPALPGTPHHSRPIDEIVAAAAAEARLLDQAGFDGLIVENMHDRPYLHGPQPPEVVAAMSLVAHAVAHAAPRLIRGVQVLSGGNREALAIAHANGGAFIRCENFVFAHVADEGLLTRAEAGPLLRYRNSINAKNIKIFADIKKKHASHALTADVSIAEAAQAAEFFSADGVIVTGAATGKPASLADVAAVRNATRLPVLVGSGVDPGSVKALFDAGADALIIGSWIKRDGLWSNPIDAQRCAQIIASRR